MSTLSQPYNFKQICNQAEGLFDLIFKCSKEEEKRKLCTLLIELMKTLDKFDTEFDGLIESIEDLNKCKDIECRTIWVQIINEISRFNIEYKREYKTDLLKHVFNKDFIDKRIKRTTIERLTDNCMSFDNISQEMKINIIKYVIFDQLLINDDDNILLTLKNSLMTIDTNFLPHYLFEFIIEVCCLLGLKYIKTILSLKIKLCNDDIKKPVIALKDKMNYILDIAKIYSNTKSIIKKGSNIIMLVILLCYYSNLNNKIGLEYFEYVTKENRVIAYRALIDLLNTEKLMRYLTKFFHKTNEVTNNSDILEPQGRTYATTYYFIHNYEKEAIENASQIVNSFFSKHTNDRIALLEDDEYLITGVLFFINIILISPNQMNYNYANEHFLESSMHLYLLLDNMLQLIHKPNIAKHIIISLNKIIERFGHNIINEWEIIIEILIIYQNVQSNVQFLSEDIIHRILLLELNGHFKGSKDSLKSLIDSLDNNSHYSLILSAKMNFDFSNQEDFCDRFESTFIEYLGTINNNEVVYSYLVNFLSHKYKSCYLNQDQSSAQIIEKVIKQNLLVIVEGFSVYKTILENFGLCLSEILYITNNTIFFKEVVCRFFEILKMDQTTVEFRDNCLIHIISKLNKSYYQKDKMIILLEILYSNSHSPAYSNKTHENEKKIIQCFIAILKGFKYNQYCEIITDDYYDKDFQGMLVINYISDMDFVDHYEFAKPFVIFKHDVLFNFFIMYLDKEHASLRISEIIMTFLSNELFKVLFYKGIPTDKLIRLIINMTNDSFIKRIQKQDYFEAMIHILVNVAYHLNCSGVNESYSFSNELKIQNNKLKKNIVEYIIKKLEYLLQIIINNTSNRDEIKVNNKKNKKECCISNGSKLLFLFTHNINSRKVNNTSKKSTKILWNLFIFI